MSFAYRNDEEVLRAHIDQALAERGGAIGGLGPEVRGIYARRLARTAAGMVGALGGAVMLIGGVIDFLARSGVSLARLLRPGEGLLTHILLASWIAAASVYLTVRLAAADRFDARVGRLPPFSGRPRVDLARLERAHPRRVAHRLVESVEAMSAALPLAALALLLPLSIHLVISMLITAAGLPDHVRAFDGWIRASAVLVGAAHATLAAACVVFGRNLPRMSAREIRETAPRSGWKALGAAVLAACFPGAILFLVPPFLAGLTGLVLVPVMFWAMGRRIAAERLQLDVALETA